MEITFTAETVGEAAPAKVEELNALCPFILEIALSCPASDFPYRGGQFLTLLDDQKKGHRFPIASPTSGKLAGRIEIHVERIKGETFCRLAAWRPAARRRKSPSAGPPAS